MIFQLFLLAYNQFSADEVVWTIGQVIGAGVWIPVILEWIYSALRMFATCKANAITTDD